MVLICFEITENISATFLFTKRIASRLCKIFNISVLTIPTFKNFSTFKGVIELPTINILFKFSHMCGNHMRLNLKFWKFLENKIFPVVFLKMFFRERYEFYVFKIQNIRIKYSTVVYLFPAYCF